jgi:predicted DsbA family dithiol-disulfide isomerase
MKPIQIINGSLLRSKAEYVARRGVLLTLLFVFALAAILFTRKQQASASLVTITEFSDFQCPYCKRAASVVEQVRQTYGERVKVVFKQMPLPMHKNAFKAAQAAVYAREQGRFCEYHDRAFAASDLSVDALNRIAEEVGLQQDEFSQCLNSQTSRAEVEKDLVDAERLGVSGTPTFFINGKAGKGANTFESLKREIYQALPNTVPNIRPVSLTSQSSLSTTVVAANTKCGGVNCDDGNACTKDICDSKSGCRHVPYEMCGSAICYNSAAIANGLANGGLAGCQSNSVCTDSSLPIGCVATDGDGDGFTDAQEDADYIDLNCNGIKEDTDFVFPHANFTPVNEGGPVSTGLLLTNRMNPRRAVTASSVVITITTGGQVGAAQFTYTINGGRSIGPAATSDAVDIRGNIRLTFANGQVNPSFIAGNTYSFSSGDFKARTRTNPTSISSTTIWIGATLRAIPARRTATASAGVVSCSASAATWDVAITTTIQSRRRQVRSRRSWMLMPRMGSRSTSIPCIRHCHIRK